MDKIEKVKQELYAIVKDELNKEAKEEIKFLRHNEKLCEKDRNQFFKTVWKNYPEKIKDLLYYFVYSTQNKEVEQQKVINKIYKKYDKEAKKIAEKINEKLQGIKDINFIYNDGFLKVYEIDTEEGKRYFKFEKIIAGGYNIQKKHLRFSVKVQKNIPKNIVVENSYIGFVPN